MPGHPQRARIALTLSAVGLLLILAACWFAARTLRPQTRLPDGTVLVYEGVTYGTEHRHRTGTGLWSLLTPALPPALAQQVGVREVTLTPTTLGHRPVLEPPGAPRNFLVFWFRRTGPWPSRFQSRLGFSYNPSRPYLPTGRARRILAGGAPQGLEAWVVTSWDRRAPRVGLAREINGLKQPLRLVIPNPGRVEGRSPEVPPLPVKARDRDLEATLRTLLADVRDDRLLAGRSSHRVSVAVLETRDFRRAGRTWAPSRVELTDDTGNWLMGPSPRFGSSPLRPWALALFATPFPVDEPWRFRVELVQSGSYAPNQLWRVGPVVLPPRNQVQRFAPVRPYRHAGFRLLGITGRNVGRAFGVYSPETSPSVYLQAPHREAAITLLEATDEHDRPVKLRLSQARGMIRAFSLLPDVSVRSVNLTLAVQERRMVTLTARPTTGRLPDDFFTRKHP